MVDNRLLVYGAGGVSDNGETAQRISSPDLKYVFVAPYRAGERELRIDYFRIAERRGISRYRSVMIVGGDACEGDSALLAGPHIHDTRLAPAPQIPALGSVSELECGIYAIG